MTEGFNDSFTVAKKDRVEIVFYTDPLCSWSWAFEPQWRRLRYEFRNNISWRYCMGGLISSWKEYNDPFNSVSRPAQMGPVWMETAHRTGMPFDPSIWIKDPPSSSYPSCIAFKCAELQSQEAGELLLRGMREAVMVRGLNIAKPEVLFQLAQEVSSKNPKIFNLIEFRTAMASAIGNTRFASDLREIRFNQIGRFPTLVIKNTLESKAVIIVGYRPYPVLLDALQSVAPGLTGMGKINVDEYMDFWNDDLKPREINEITETSKTFVR